MRGVSTRLDAGVRSDATEGPIDRHRARPVSALSELFAPLDRLLGSGGDPRLNIDPASATNDYGCRLSPCPNLPSFASSTATSISERAYGHAGRARQSLMRRAVARGMDEAFDARIEAMRDELKACLGLSPDAAEVIFSPSGTDSQLHALLLVRALLGPALTTVIVAADQTGSGTAETARGHHFSTATATGSRVLKGEPVAGPARSVASVAIGLLDERGDCRAEAETDAMVLGAIEALRGKRDPGPAPDHGLLEARLARAERAMPRRNRGALARSGPNRRRRVPDAPRPPAAAKISRSRLSGDRHRLEVFHRTRLQRRAAGARKPCQCCRRDRRDRARVPRVQQPERLAGALAGVAVLLPGPGQSRPMASLGSGAGGDPGLSRRARSDFAGGL